MAARILVVDDDPTILALVREILQDEGYDVATARNGAEALKRVAETVPAVLVTDLMMPVMNGRALVRACRATPATATLPIVLMSAALPVLIDNLTQLGVEDALHKPFDTDVLIAMIARLVAAGWPAAGA
jgi:twitching motility two-component system response regulator PilH